MRVNIDLVKEKLMSYELEEALTLIAPRPSSYGTHTYQARWDGKGRHRRRGRPGAGRPDSFRGSWRRH